MRHEPVLQAAARRLLGGVDDVLVVGADVEVVILQAPAEREERRLGLQHGDRRERRVAATRPGLCRIDRVDGVLPRDFDPVLLLEFGRVDIGRAQPLAPGSAGRGEREILFRAGPPRQPHLGERYRGGPQPESRLELASVDRPCHERLPVHPASRVPEKRGMRRYRVACCKCK